MPRMILVLLVALASACNVFFALDSVEPETTTPNGNPNATTVNATTTTERCDGDCVCTGTSCTIACADACEVQCLEEAMCEGNVPDGSTIICADSSCEVACTDGTCRFDCTQRGSTCEPRCPSGTECILDCGTNRNEVQLARCEFAECGSEVVDCGSRIYACGAPCP